jgi:hypothetical protein
MTDAPRVSVRSLDVLWTVGLVLTHYRAISSVESNRDRWDNDESFLRLNRTAGVEVMVKSPRFCFLIPVFMSALAAAQSDPAIHASQANALPAFAAVGAQMAAATAEPAFRFNSVKSYPAGGLYSQSAAMADLNGDGHLDLVLANLCQSQSDCLYIYDLPGSISVLIGNGDGTFQPPVSYLSGGIYPLSVAIGDVNRDGVPDLVVANDWITPFSADGAVSVFLGNGDGTFQAPLTYSSGGSGANSVAIGDVNGDGDPDLVVSNACETNNGSGCTGELGVLLGKGDGTFQPVVTYTTGKYHAGSLVLSDLKGNGHLDAVVVISCYVDVCLEGGVAVLLGNGHGAFRPPVFYTWEAEDGVGPLAVADLNGDGHPDLVVNAPPGVLS